MCLRLKAKHRSNQAGDHTGTVDGGGYIGHQGAMWRTLVSLRHDERELYVW
jgi:hypothetical protein